MVEFAKGVKVKTVATQYGEIIKIGVNLEEFANNIVNDDGWINFDILTSKNGKKYAAIDTYKPKAKGENIDDEDIPF